MSPSLLRRFAFFFSLSALATLLALLGACGGPATPKGPDAIQVGHGDGGAPLQVVGQAQASARDTSDEDARIPIGPDDAVRGSRNAYVTIVIFSDFQCPFCGRVAPTLDRIREEYGSENVRFVFKHLPLPFHNHAKLAATVSQGVLATRGPDAFWRYHDMAFRSQRGMDPDAIRQWAIASGLDEREIDAGLQRGTWADKVERDMELAKRLGTFGTPNFFINGRELGGAQPFEKFKEAIDEELAKAKAMEARGTPRAKIYREAVALNYVEPKQRPADDDDDDDKPDTTVWKVPVGGSPARGPATAPVTIVVFSDFQCPYCKRVEPTLEKIRKEYGAKVRLVWKDEPLPFHPRAVPAANLAREARAQKGDAAFWDVHDKLFDKQPNLDDADLEGIARAAGLDVKKAMAAVAKGAHKKGIDADMDLGDEVQASGTPHFFINGRRLVGAQPYEKFKGLIDEELPKAEAKIRAGTAANAVYDAIIATGKAGPDLERKSVAANASAPFRGPANAPVVIQHFSDFQCPFCSRVEPTLDELLKEYPQKVKIVWRDLPLPFHQNAPLAAEAAREAFAQKGNAGFSKMRELMFKNQQQLDRASLEGYAQTVGLDMAKFKKALDNRVHQKAVQADVDAANAAGISGTPSFVVGPFFVSGAQPLTKFKKAVERALKEPPPGSMPAAAGTAPAAGTAAGPSAPATSLGIVDLVKGSGREVKSGDSVTVHYTGMLTDGTVFDTSKKRGQPFDFTVGKGVVIKGWDQGLLGMKVGGKRKLTIPPDLAYGTRGVPGTIPPGSTLVFEVELLSIK